MLNKRHVASWLVAGGLLCLLAVPRAAADSFPWHTYEAYPNSWFESFEAKQIALNVLSHQTPEGSWPQNIDTGAKKFEGDPKTLRGTFENGAGSGEMRYVTRMFIVTKDERYQAAFDKGLKHLLDAQYPTGGWPTYHPPGKNYSRHIAFNDDCMLNVLDLLLEVAEGRQYTFLRKDFRETVRGAYDRGLDCIVKCQIVANGELTGWCARHDEKTLEPRPARKHEPAAICAAETASVLLFLMNVEAPSAGLVKAVHAGCAWYDRVKFPGIRLENKDGSAVVVRDSKAPHLWSRFYEIGTNRPLFCESDGTVKYKLADIEVAMRNEYAWYGNWGHAVVKRYATWKDQHPMP